MKKEYTSKEFVEIVDKARHIFPEKEKMKIVVSLLQEWIESKSSTVFYLPRIKKTEPIPFKIPFCILSSDWPGFSDSCIGVLHERGWNISYIEGFVTDYKGQELGVIFLIIRIKTEAEKYKFISEKSNILKDLTVVAAGSKAKASLLALETKKLKIYAHVTEKIKEIVKSKDELEDILRKDGEAFKFFSSRSESYLEERSYTDLAQQIVTNYRFQQRVRKTGGKPQFWIKNIKTTREQLTGITIAAFERDISLNEWLEAIYNAVPDYNIKYNKEFVTSDGIAVFRIEICARNESSYSQKKIGDIRKALMKAHISRKIEKVRWIELTGGFEQYMRAIIPLLVKECLHSKITQVYISVAKMTTELVKFKILVVSYIIEENTLKHGYRIAEALEKEKGINIISTKPPKKYGECEVNIIDIEVNLIMFPDVEDIYEVIRRCIKSVVGEFRDFDEGMRRLEVTKLLQIKEMLKEYPVNIVKEFYYRIDDFYRVGATAEEIAEQIRLGIKGLEKYERQEKDYVLIVKNYSQLKDATGGPSFTVIVLVYPSQLKLLSQFLYALKDYEVTLCRVERRDLTVIILRVQKKNKAMTEDEIYSIKNFFKNILISEDNVKHSKRGRKIGK